MSRQIRRFGMSLTVEVPIMTKTKNVFNFSDSVISLDNVLIHAYYIRCSNAKSLEFRDNLPVNDLQSCYLNLIGLNDQQLNMRYMINSSKAYGFYNIDGSGTWEPVFIKPKLISIRKSSIEVPNVQNLIIPANGYGINVTFFYDTYDPQKHHLNRWGELVNDTDDSN